MKCEHFVVAELYRHLAGFVDTDYPIYLSLDGVAAKRGVRESLFKDPDVPDLCFTMLDGRAVAIEVKVTGNGRRISAGRRQYEAWFGNAPGAHKPTGWVVAHEREREFYSYWSHAEIVQQRQHPPGASEDRYVAISMPTRTPMFRSLRHLALHVIRVSP